MGQDASSAPLFDPTRWSPAIADLRQNSLLDESSFISFASRRGVPVYGVIEGDPSAFFLKGWLRSDGLDYQGKPLFHPFRLYPVKKILDACNLHIARSASLRRGDAAELFGIMLAEVPSDDEIRNDAAEWNDIADLAILLEPVWWPLLAGQTRIAASVQPLARRDRFLDYRNKVLSFLKELDPAHWSTLHLRLRREAAAMDDNPELYILLRSAHWESREKLTGAISGSLWIRHIAEVIRRGFEDAYGVQWPEEYQSYAKWFSSGLELSFGSSRPLDDLLRTQPYVLQSLGVHTGSKVRWYVEGETEYYAVRELLSEPARLGIELVNLRGVIRADRDNIALKLGDWLREDQKHNRFSILSLDRDVAANSKAIRQHIRERNIIGYIAAHDPDFEIANFSVPELLDLASQRAVADAVPAISLESVDPAGITCARDLEERYARLFGRKLKGEPWGRILARAAGATPIRADTGAERPIMRTARIALDFRIAHYDIRKEYFGFDPVTFEAIRIKDYPPHIVGA